MTSLVVLTEEKSAKIVVENLVGRIIPDWYSVVLVHQGKTDLQQSVTRKIRSWRHPVGTRFIILRDNDGGDCVLTKKEFTELIPQQQRPRTSVRLVMQCLESWYLGDLPALTEAGLLDARKAERLRNKSIYRNPDRVPNAKQIFMNLHGEHGQVNLAQKISPYMSLDDNMSPSFRLFVRTLRSL